MKILISDNVSQGCARILEETDKIKVTCRIGLKPEELAEIIGEYDGLVVRSATKVTKEILEHAKKLKIIGRAGTGVDNVDIDEATRCGIIVMNTPGGNTISTAEHTLCMLLALSRNISQAAHSVREGKWEKKHFMGVEIRGKKLGVIGLGNVGREVVSRAKAFAMDVIGYDPYLSVDAAKKIGVRLTNLNTIFKESDYITVHTPHNEETHHIISSDGFSKMKKGVRILNCARGGIIDEKALLDAIRSGKVAGAALDVFEKEPPSDNPLLQEEHVICTPHLGASTEEAQESVAIQIAEQVRDFILDGTLRNAVNLPPIEPDMLNTVQPYIGLGERLGSLTSQLVEGQPQRVRIEYRGDVLDVTTWPITASILQGILKSSFVEGINLVNAQIMADARGVHVEEIRSSNPTDFMSLITIDYETDIGEHRVSGTLFGKEDPRLVLIDDFDMDAVPEGNMLICGNRDMVGIIGTVGTILEKAGINIARMSWSRTSLGGDAITVLGTDTPVPDDVIGKILSQEGFQWVKRIKV